VAYFSLNVVSQAEEAFANGDYAKAEELAESAEKLASDAGTGSMFKEETEEV